MIRSEWAVDSKYNNQNMHTGASHRASNQECKRIAFDCIVFIISCSIFESKFYMQQIDSIRTHIHHSICGVCVCVFALNGFCPCFPLFLFLFRVYIFVVLVLSFSFQSRISFHFIWASVCAVVVWFLLCAFLFFSERSYRTRQNFTRIVSLRANDITNEKKTHQRQQQWQQQNTKRPNEEEEEETEEGKNTQHKSTNNSNKSSKNGTNPEENIE